MFLFFNFVLIFFFRTSTWCYKQAITLVVEQPGACGRPRLANQRLTNGVTGSLTCPLRECMDKLKSYNVSYSLKWYKVSRKSVDKKKKILHCGIH